MAEFSKLVITNQGRALIAEVLAEEQNLVFTKISASDAVYTIEQLEALKELSSIRQTGDVSKIIRTDDVTVRIETALTNTDLAEGYYIRTIGLYAQNINENEVLYAVAVETSGNCYMPAFGGTTVSGAYIQLITTVSNAEKVYLEVSDAVYATIGDIRDLQAQIDGMGELLGDVASLCSTNAEKLGHLNRMGECVLKKELNFLSAEVAYPGSVASFSIPQSELSELDNKTYYIYVLEAGSNGIQFFDADDLYKELYGRIYLTFKIGINTFADYLPVTMMHSNIYTIPLHVVQVDGAPTSISINLSSKFFERADGRTVETEGKLNLICNLRLKIYRFGYLLDTVPDSVIDFGSGASGTSNYNALSNKPSINDVILQGNLTSEELGIPSGDIGDLTEMTEEEVEIIVNQTTESEV